MSWVATRISGRIACVLGALACACLATVPSGCGRDRDRRQQVWQESHELPENFPKNVPVYPKAELKTVVRGKGAVIFWETPDRVEVVKDFYARELAANGWKVTTYPGLAAAWMGDSGVTVIATGWGRQLSFALAEQPDKTSIMVVLPRL